MKIGITFNLKEKPSAGLPEDTYEEWDAEETIDRLASALESGGHEVVELGWGLEVLEKIRRRHVDFVFNIAEGIEGRTRESLLPALFELAGIPYSGSDPLTLALTLDKARAKMIVAPAGVATPEFQVVEDSYAVETLPAFPLFVKPLHEGSSKGIRASSRVETESALREQISWLRLHYGPIPILIERYIAGREFTVGVLGNRDPYLLGIMEIRFRGRETQDFIYSLEVKRDWEKLCEYVAPPVMDPSLEHKIRRDAVAAYRALGCRDVARLDFRVDVRGVVYFLEANPLPGLSPVSGDLVILAKRMGWTYEKLILTILAHAQERYRARECMVREN